VIISHALSILVSASYFEVDNKMPIIEVQPLATPVPIKYFNR